MSEEPPFPEIPETPPAPKEKRKGNYVNASYKILELTEAQKATVRAQWDKMDLKTLTRLVFDNQELNGHNTEAKSIKSYIASLSIDGKETPPKIATTQHITKGELELTQPQVDSIVSLLSGEEPPSINEIVKMLFPEFADKAIIPTTREYRAVLKVVKSCNENAVDIWDEPVVERRYKPPFSYSSIVGLVNKHVNNPVDTRKALYDMATIKPSHERNLKALLSHMKSTKFVLEASMYDRRVDRDLFESTFIRQTQDKAADLTPEEVDTYIAIAAGTVRESQVERQIAFERRMSNDCLEGNDETGNKAKLSMSLVESIKALQGERKELKSHTHKLITSVSGSRSARLKEKGVKDDYLGNLIEAWREEEKRLELIELAKKEHMEDTEEFNKIKSLDHSFALIAGMTRAEAEGGF